MVQRVRSDDAEHLFYTYVCSPSRLPQADTRPRAEYAYFFFYSFIRTAYTKRLASRLPKGSKVPPLSTAAELALGAVAGALSQIFTIPVSVIATRQQIGKSLRQTSKPSLIANDKDGESEGAECRIEVEPGSTDEEAQEQRARKEESETDDNSFVTVAREIIREDGITGLWRGLKPSMVLTVNPAITYGMYERLKGILLLARAKTGADEKMTPWMSFVLGAFSKTLATIVSEMFLKKLPFRALVFDVGWIVFRRRFSLLRGRRGDSILSQSELTTKLYR